MGLMSYLVWYFLHPIFTPPERTEITLLWGIPQQEAAAWGCFVLQTALLCSLRLSLSKQKWKT